jgi:hypothetical protein
LRRQDSELRVPIERRQFVCRKDPKSPLDGAGLDLLGSKFVFHAHDSVALANNHGRIFVLSEARMNRDHDRFCVRADMKVVQVLNRVVVGERTIEQQTELLMLNRSAYRNQVGPPTMQRVVGVKDSIPKIAS